MGMQIARFFWMGLTLGMAIALFPTAVPARNCRSATATPPSRQLKEFRVDEFDLLLGIPDNYRSMLRSDGRITFHDPSSFEFIQCLVRTGEYGEVPPYPALEVSRGVTASDLVAIVRARRPWLDYYNPEYQSVEFLGQTAIQYEYKNEIYSLTIANLSFLSQDGKTLLTLTGPADHPILMNAFTSINVAPSVPTSLEDFF